MQCLTFDSWESGREALRLSLLVEQSKVGDLLFMKYKVQLPIFEMAASEAKFKDLKEVKDFEMGKQLALAKAQAEKELSFELNEEQKRLMKQISQKAGKIGKDIGHEG